MVKLKLIKKGKKLFSVLLAVIIVTLTMAPAVAAIDYPAGITKQMSENAVQKTDTLIYSLLKQTQNKTLSELLMPEICSSQTLSMLTVEIYKAVEASADTLSALNLDTSTGTVAACLSAYPDVSQKIAAASTWEQVNLDGADWGVSTKEGFADAAAAIFTPFNALLYTILCKGSYSLNALIGIQGDYGYENAIVPVLKNFGCRSITDSSTFYADAENDKSSMVRHIVTDLMSFVEDLLSAPCDRMTDVLPGIAYFINNGGLDKAIASLIEPLKVKVLMITIPIDVQSFMNSEESSEGFTFDLNLGDMVSVSDFKTAEIDLKLLEQCGTVSGDTVVSDKGATFIVVLRWLIETMKLNKDTLPTMLGDEGGQDMTKMLNAVMSKSTDEIITVLIELFNQTAAVNNDYQWFFNALVPTSVSYTPNLGAEKYQRVLDGIDDLLNEFVKESGESETIREVLQPQIYSNKLVSELVVGIYSALSGEELKQLTELMGLSVSPSDLAAELTEAKFSTVKAQLNSCYSWNVVKTDNITWGFKDGDKDGFVDAVSAVFRPFDEIFRMLLAGGKIQLFGAVDIYGSDGYNTAIIPVLEALGVSSESILTQQEYVKAIENSDVMRPIAVSLTSLIERILDRPVYTVTQILPNIMYFFNNSGIEIVIKNLLHPVFSVMEKLGLSDMLDMSQMTQMDMSSVMESMTKEMDLGMTLPELDLKQFGNMGQLVSVPSKRTQQGSLIMIYSVQADQTAVLITLLRWLVTGMKMPGNENMMASFMGGGSGGGEDDMFASYSADITKELETMSVDETIEWLYKLFFRERPVVEEKPTDDYMPTVIYKGKFNFPWAKVLTAIFFIVGIGLFFGLANRDRIRIFLDDRKEKKQNKAASAHSQEV